MLLLVNELLRRRLVAAIYGIQLATRRDRAHLHKFFEIPGIEELCRLFHGFNKIFLGIALCPKTGRGHCAVNEHIIGLLLCEHVVLTRHFRYRVLSSA
ncbi:MAG TPA: hypothetical protein DCZ84_00840, partial [Candidatus Vogelbacteria bacterium]|nr:hypothetical protein [Candidatus Vogelbacteria bacterium]